jgi:hypothetical protein
MTHAINLQWIPTYFIHSYYKYKSQARSTQQKYWGIDDPNVFQIARCLLKWSGAFQPRGFQNDSVVADTI